MRSSRRDFLQASAAAASALSLTPLALESAVEARAQSAHDPNVRAAEASRLRAHPVPLDRVRLTGGPLQHAQQLDGAYLLSLDPDRMLAFYRIRAGLPQKAEPYGGWDGPGRNLTGHIAGHHLSAVSLMYLATGDARFKDRASYLVSELKIVQDQQGDGYLGALENGRQAFAAVSKGDIRSGGFDLNGLWSPWYVLHKLFAGLRDAYRHTGNRTALDLSVKFAGWADGILAPLDEAQIQKMLNTEHGGMNEVLADLYADTGDRRWLVLSNRFEHRAFTDALKRGQDNLNGKHGNCQIPKLVGSAARYGYTGEPGDLLAASFFWDRVTQHHSYASGGHGLDEYFGPPDELSRRVDGRTCESCNVYNMLKLTRRLFAIRPDAFYADFHERAIFNHILASMDPKDGRTSYMVPVGHGVMQEYQNMQQSFTCCVGSGMESHALHGDGLYYESDDTLWVNLFAPSTVTFAQAGLGLTMETGFPDGDTATLMVTAKAPKAITIAVRRPHWAGDGFAVSVNGERVTVPAVESLSPGAAGGRPVVFEDEVAFPSSSFVALTRTWKTGDRIDLALPKSLRLEPTRDDRHVSAILWGPLALAADLGPRREGRGAPAPAIPALVAGDRPPTEWLTPAATPGDFQATDVARVPGSADPPVALAFAPFYRTYERTYSLYFDVLTPAEFNARGAAMAAERERVRRLAAATVGFVQPGQMQPERDANYQSDPAERPVQRINGRASRGGAGSFSFDLPVDPAAPAAVVVTYLNQSGQPAAGSFDILVDGTAIGRFAANPGAEGFYDQSYAVPVDLVRGKTKVTVKFQATNGGRITPVFGVRTIRAGGGSE